MSQNGTNSIIINYFGSTTDRKHLGCCFPKQCQTLLRESTDIWNTLDLITSVSFTFQNANYVVSLQILLFTLNFST